MKVLHVFKTYIPDSLTGIERVIWETAEGVAEKGVESHVLFVSKSPSPRVSKVDNHFAHRAKCNLHLASTSLSFSIFKAFRELAGSVDLIHYHFPWPMMDFVHLAERPRCPTVVTYHSDIVRQRRLMPLYRPIMCRFLDSVDCIVATSPNYQESSPVLQKYRDKTVVIPIGISAEEKPERALVDRWRHKVGEDFFLFVGAPRYYKGLPVLLEAARATGLNVVIVGAEPSEIDGAGDALPNVTVVGRVSEESKLALLQLCKAFVFPSNLRSEAFGVALVEAARAGKAMISCEIGTGTSYVNIDGETGIVVPPDDPQELARAMRAMADDPAMTGRMGRNARQRFERHFQAEDMCAAHLEVYENLLLNRKRADGLEEASAGA